MSKKLFIAMLLGVVAIFSFTGVVAAQGTNPPDDAPGYGYPHDYMIAYAADALGLSVEEIEARIDGGETLAQIALAEGVEDFYSFMQDARAYVLEQLEADGITIPGWSAGHGQGQWSQGGMMGAGTCLDGTTTPIGRGPRGGGRR